MHHHSTDEVHPRDRIAYWREVATRTFVRHDFRSGHGTSFSASIQSGPLADLSVAAFECDPCQVGRTTRDSARDSNEDIHLLLNVTGKVIAEQDGREAVNEAGSFMFLDMRRPFNVVFESDSKANTFVIPRRLLKARLGRTAAFTARSIELNTPLAKMAAGYLAMLPDCVDTLDAAAASKVAEQALDLVALAYSMTAPGAHLTLSSAKATALVRLKTVINAQLTNPELGPGMAAAAAGLSIRYANTLLAEEGMSLERYIVAQRLDRCRRALEDPAQSHRMIADIAFGWGFWDVSHFCRRFKAEFGLSPRDYRNNAKQRLPASDRAAPFASGPA
jgi:AraC-like DNA-binding protein